MARKKTENPPPVPDVAIPVAHVARVTTNLKTPGEAPRTADLSRLTLIVGPSGAGKTTLIDAVELGLVGASPTRGLGKSVPNLKRALPTGAPSLNVALELSTGETITWSLERSAKDPVWSAAGGFPLVGSGVLLPAAGTVVSVSDALDLLLGYDKNRILAILDGVPTAPIEVKKLADATAGIARELAVRLEGALPTDGSIITPAQLRSALSTVEALLNEYKKSKAACEAFRVDGLTGAEEDELNTMERALAAGSGAEFVRDAMNRLELQMSAAQNELEGCRKLIDESVPGYFTTRQLAADAFNLIQQVLGLMDDRGVTEGRCPLDGETHPIEKFRERRDQFEKALAQLETRVGTWGEQVRQSGERWLQLSTQKMALAEMLTTMGANEAGVDEARLAELRHRRREAQLAIAAGAKLAAIEGYERTLTAVQSALLECATAAVAEPAEAVRRRMNKVLPRGRAARVECKDAKVLIGQQRDNGPIVPVGALSGSERVVFAAALAVALQGARIAPVNLLVIDETMFDRKTLKQVLAALSRVFDSDGGPTQVLVCTSEWSGKVPPGWTLLDLTEKAEEKPDVEENAENTAASEESTASAENPGGNGAEPAKNEENAAPASPVDDVLSGLF